MESSWPSLAERKGAAEAALAHEHASYAVLLLWDVDDWSPKHLQDLRSRAIEASRSAQPAAGAAGAGAGAGACSTTPRDVVEAAIQLERLHAAADMAGCRLVLHSMRLGACGGGATDADDVADRGSNNGGGGSGSKCNSRNSTSREHEIKSERGEGTTTTTTTSKSGGSSSNQSMEAELRKLSLDSKSRATAFMAAGGLDSLTAILSALPCSARGDQVAAMDIGEDADVDAGMDADAEEVASMAVAHLRTLTELVLGPATPFDGVSSRVVTCLATALASAVARLERCSPGTGGGGGRGGAVAVRTAADAAAACFALSDGAVQHSAADQGRSYSKMPAARATLVQHGVHTALLDVLVCTGRAGATVCLGGASERLLCRLDALRCLRCLSRDAPLRRELAAAGALPVLLSACSPEAEGGDGDDMRGGTCTRGDASLAARVVGLEVLINLACLLENKQKLLDAGAAAVLLRCCQEHPAGDSAAGSGGVDNNDAYLELQEAALSCMGCMTFFFEPAAAQLVQHGVLSAVCGVLPQLSPRPAPSKPAIQLQGLATGFGLAPPTAEVPSGWMCAPCAPQQKKAQPGKPATALASTTTTTAAAAAAAPLTAMGGKTLVAATDLLKNLMLLPMAQATVMSDTVAAPKELTDAKRQPSPELLPEQLMHLMGNIAVPAAARDNALSILKMLAAGATARKAALDARGLQEAVRSYEAITPKPAALGPSNGPTFADFNTKF